MALLKKLTAVGAVVVVGLALPYSVNPEAGAASESPASFLEISEACAAGGCNFEPSSLCCEACGGEDGTEGGDCSCENNYEHSAALDDVVCPPGGC